MSAVHWIRPLDAVQPEFYRQLVFDELVFGEFLDGHVGVRDDRPNFVNQRNPVHFFNTLICVIVIHFTIKNRSRPDNHVVRPHRPAQIWFVYGNRLQQSKHHLLLLLARRLVLEPRGQRALQRVYPGVPLGAIHPNAGHLGAQRLELVHHQQILHAPQDAHLARVCTFVNFVFFKSIFTM